LLHPHPDRANRDFHLCESHFTKPKRQEVMSTAALAITKIERNPVLVYLASLRASGRRSMASRLATVANMFGHVGDPAQLQWPMLRFEHVEAIRSRLLEEGSAPASVNTTLCALRGVARAAWNLCQMSAEDYYRICRVRPARGVRLPSGRALTQGEITALMDACARDPTIAGARDAAIVAVLVGAGLRRGEIIALQINHWHSETRALKVGGKGNKERFVYLSETAAGALSDWIRMRGPDEGPLFMPVRKDGAIQRRPMTDQAVYNVLSKRAKQARVAKCSPHDFRRTFASELIDRSDDLSAVKELLGHTDIQTTAGYDRRGEKSKQRAADLLDLPFKSRFPEVNRRS
jgi:integrase/recombinase XerD